MLSEEDTDKLKKKLSAIDDLLKANLITRDRATDWKARVVDEFEQSDIPAVIEKKLPNDLSHLPGRMIGGAVNAMKAIARGSGATYEALSKQEGYDPQTGDRVQQSGKRRAKDPNEMLDNLPEMYR